VCVCVCVTIRSSACTVLRVLGVMQVFELGRRNLVCLTVCFGTVWFGCLRRFLHNVMLGL